MKNAVLVIDVQRLMSGGKYECFDARGVIARINGVMARGRAAGAPVFIIQHESRDGPLAHGSDGWQLDAGLDARPADHFVRKTATDSFHLTDLHDRLRALGIAQLVICGFQSDFCVDTTTRRALALGYPVTLVSDGHSTLDNGVLTAAQITAHHNVTLANIESFGPRARAVPASEVVL